MSKTLCKTSDKDKLQKKQQEPLYKCKKCERMANKEKYVCKPVKI